MSCISKWSVLETTLYHELRVRLGNKCRARALSREYDGSSVSRHPSSFWHCQHAQVLHRLFDLGIQGKMLR